jgi:hypothetical protein
MTCILMSHTCVLNLFPVLGSRGGLLCRTLRFCKGIYLALKITDWLRDTVARSFIILYLFLPWCVFTLDICFYAVCSNDIYTCHSNIFFVVLLLYWSVWVKEVWRILGGFQSRREQQVMHCACVAVVLFKSVITCCHVLGLLKDEKVIRFWKQSSVAFLEVFIFIVPLMLFSLYCHHSVLFGPRC